MVNIILICFKRNNKNLKKFDKKLYEEKIDFEKETNDDWYNYRFNNKNIQIISYYIIYFSLKIENEEYYIKEYIRIKKNLTEKECDEVFISERKRFGK